VRFGYRRLLVMMHREGWAVGKHRFYRVYTEEGLALRRKRPWRHATAVHRERRRPAVARNEIWSMDFVADQLADGRRFRALTVIDLFTRECLAIDVGHGLGGQDVVAALERLRFERGLLRQRGRVCQQCDGSVGLHQRRHAGLQSSVPHPVSWTREGDIDIAPPPSIVDADATVRSRFIAHAAVNAARAATGV